MLVIRSKVTERLFARIEVSPGPDPDPDPVAGKARIFLSAEASVGVVTTGAGLRFRADRGTEG
jgi:hypothetical protein